MKQYIPGLVLALPLIYDYCSYQWKYKSVWDKIEISFNSLGEVTMIAVDINGDELYILRDRLEKIPIGSKIHLVLKTRGGYSSACYNICEFFKKNRKAGGWVKVYIKDYAASAGTLISLSADEFYWTDDFQFVSPIDYQFYGLPIKSTPFLGWMNSYNKKIVSGYINPKYDVLNIMKKLYDEPPSHSIPYFNSEIDDILDYKIEITSPP